MQNSELERDKKRSIKQNTAIFMLGLAANPSMPLDAPYIVKTGKALALEYEREFPTELDNDDKDYQKVWDDEDLARIAEERGFILTKKTE